MKKSIQRTALALLAGAVLAAPIGATARVREHTFHLSTGDPAAAPGPMGMLLDKLQAKGLVGRGFWEIGFRQATNSRRALTKWEDMDGLKMRTVQSPVFREFFNSTGANAVPMAINEVWRACASAATH